MSRTPTKTRCSCVGTSESVKFTLRRSIGRKFLRRRMRAEHFGLSSSHTNSCASCCTKSLVPIQWTMDAIEAKTGEQECTTPAREHSAHSTERATAIRSRSSMPARRSSRPCQHLDSPFFILRIHRNQNIHRDSRFSNTTLENHSHRSPRLFGGCSCS